jgi:hypothetical protein
MRVGLIVAASVLLVSGALAQRFGGGLRFQGHDDGPSAQFPAKGEFHFIRTEYTDLPQASRGFGFSSRNGRGNGWWLVDWPDADEHFSTGVERLTRIDTAQPLHMSLTDDRLFDNPWIYATQTGYWGLNRAEIARLREYLLRGGFLMVDDFWGPEPEQWEVFKETMELVLPNKPISDIVASDPVMHVLYDIEEKDRSFIPGTRHLRVGPGGTVVVQQPSGTTPAWRAMYDDKNRQIVAVNYNTDIGDAWEYADAPEYPEHMTALAYRYGINYIVYAMTH